MRVLSTDSALAHGFSLGPWRVQPQEGSIERDGERHHLGPRQMDLLLFLADHRQDVVGKKEIFQAVWQGAAVEDGALARCISELRRLLGDNARHPQFILTVPRRGYRLIGAVQIGHPAAPEAACTDDLSALEIELPVPRTPLTAADQLSDTHVSRRRVSVWKHRFAPNNLARVAILILTVGLLAFVRPEPGLPLATTGLTNDSASILEGTGHSANPSSSSPAPAAQDRPRVAVLGFKNLSGDPQNDWLKAALAETLAAELAAASELSVVTPSTVGAMEQQIFVGVDTRKAAPYAARRHLRHVLHLDSIIFGSFLNLDDSEPANFRLDIWIDHGGSMEAATVISETGSDTDMMQLLRQAGARLRRALGVNVDDTPAIADGLRQSSEAVRRYHEGRQLLQRYQSSQPPSCAP